MSKAIAHENIPNKKWRRSHSVSLSQGKGDHTKSLIILNRDRSGVRYPTSKERTARAEAIADRERQQKEKLAAYLRSLGVNPNDI
jgi:hypothetical protein